MQFIFSTGSLYTYGTERCFQFAVEAGFDGVEIMVDQRWDTRQPDYLRRLVSRYSIPVVAVHSPFFDVPGWPHGQPAMIRKSVALAEALGANIVIHHLPFRVGYAIFMVGNRRLFLPLFGWRPEDDYQRWLVQDYPILQATTPVTLCIENLPARKVFGRRANAHHWNTVEEIRRFPCLTMDTTHLGTWGLEPLDIYARWQGKVRHVHLSNFDGREHRRPEYGELKLNHLLARLGQDGYGGAISLELHPDALDAGQSDRHIVTLLSNSLQLCRSWALGADGPQ